jgi:hypothetical protein
VKIKFKQQLLTSVREEGFLDVDVAVGLVILAVAILPLGFSFMHERKAFEVDYGRAVANEIVDGEIEILAAGDWKSFPDGRQTYTVHSRAAANLPVGHFELIKNGTHLRLEWLPDAHQGVGAVIREMTLP